MNVQKKLLLIGQFPPPYHGTSIALDTIRSSEIINKYYCITQINTNRPDLPTDVEIGKIRWYKITQDIYHIFSLFNKLLTEKPCLVYITIAQTKWGYLRDGIFIVVSRLFKKKCIVHLHGGYFRLLYNNSWKLFQCWVKFTLRQVDVAIVLTESLRSIFAGLVDDNRIKVVINCIDDYLFPTSTEIEEKVDRIKKRSGKLLKVLFLSNLLKSKGYMDVLKAAILLKQKGISAQFLFAGNWPNAKEQSEAINFIKKNNLDNVEFLGFVKEKEKKQLLLDSDIFILPTYYYEGLPISILEAMATGLPIITTRHGGIPGIIEEGINGFFVPPGNPEMIAETIEKLYFHPYLQAKIAEENIKKALNNFKKEHYEKSLLEIFNKVLN